MRLSYWFVGSSLSLLFLSGCGLPKTSSKSSSSSYRYNSPSNKYSSKKDLNRDAEVQKAMNAIRAANKKTDEIAAEEADIARDMKDTTPASERLHYVKLKERFQRLRRMYAERDRIFSKELLGTLLVLNEFDLYKQIIDINRRSSETQRSYLETMEKIDWILLASAKEVPVPAPIPEANSPIIPASVGGYVTGVVRDSVKGTPISGAKVSFREADESQYFHSTWTNASGEYKSPPLRRGNYAIDIENNGYVTSRRAQIGVETKQITQENVSLTTPVKKGEFRITMSWTDAKANAVRDVDSYLLTPDSNQPIYYGHRNGITADLDRDDTDWIGPETVTIHVVKNRIYRYYVNNFSERYDNEALGRSAVRVQVYQGDRMVRSYSVPAGRGNTYELFQIENGAIRDVERYNDNLKTY